jgi:hypothetical protein
MFSFRFWAVTMMTSSPLSSVLASTEAAGAFCAQAGAQRSVQVPVSKWRTIVVFGMSASPLLGTATRSQN